MIRRFATRLIACLMLSVVCSGCITAAVVGLVALGCVAIAGSGNHNADLGYLITSVDSGIVPSTTKLQYRYCIARSRVYKMAKKKHRCDRYLNKLSGEDIGMTMQPIMEAMFPNVFFAGDGAIPIQVELQIRDVYTGNDVAPNTSLRADVVVRDAHSGDLFETERFTEELGKCLVGETNILCSASEYQTFRRQSEVDQDSRALEKAIFEGYAGAIVAALEKFETGGKRSGQQGAGPRYVDIADVTYDQGETNQEDFDNTAVAVDFFMGSMGAINSMNQANRARSHARHVQRMSEITARRMNVGGRNSAASQSSMPLVEDASPQLPRVCPMCGGSGKCRPCNGNGRIASVDAIANGKSSDYHIINSGPSATAVMAQSRGGCGPCGGTGKCRGCNGSGHR